MPDELRLTFQTTIPIPENLETFERARFVLKTEEAVKAAKQALVDAVGDIPWDVKVREVTPRRRGDDAGGDGGNGES